MNHLVLPPPLDSEVAAEFYCDELLDGQGRWQYLDNPRSVSGLIRSDSPETRPGLILLPKEGPHGS